MNKKLMSYMQADLKRAQRTLADDREELQAATREVATAAAVLDEARKLLALAKSRDVRDCLRELVNDTRDVLGNARYDVSDAQRAIKLSTAAIVGIKEMMKG